MSDFLKDEKETLQRLSYRKEVIRALNLLLLQNLTAVPSLQNIGHSALPFQSSTLKIVISSVLWERDSTCGENAGVAIESPVVVGTAKQLLRLIKLSFSPKLLLDIFLMTMLDMLSVCHKICLDF